MAELQAIVNDAVLPPPPPALNSAEAPAAAVTKRLRKPSVRLGEICGDQYHAAFDSQARKPKWAQSKSSRTRTLTNLSSGHDNNITLDDDNDDDDEREENHDSLRVGNWRVKKRVGSSTTTIAAAAAKRVRSNWVSKIGETDHGDEIEGGFRDFSREDTESPIKEESLVRVDEDVGFRRRRRGGREGVKIWLQELGLGRYWAMFEIHEVDEEALPLLTLEDLKDMGINAVGSRRKMFCAIQKLSREFS
ncbi:unnamed protein product [Cochlearia groenlandica]